MNTILKAENISKQYRLGLVGTGTLGDDLKRAWYNLRGKEDPFLKIGAVNDRGAKASEDYVWALKDINFEVKEGEVLGIIGKNGAGKSTLLKLLSRVTSPTTGSIKTRGRIASLLEIGTGFHPELTGRENIFMNGAVLGMTRAEIKSKLDEIIAFSGCAKYIDTPVKRYSSGMTVRLGFAVAAHLEPEILVVDEVLAVGDAEFQKRAIGKMQDLSNGEGRTVLFVSHNMASVQDLCTKALVLANGHIVFAGPAIAAVNNYLNLTSISLGFRDFKVDNVLAKSRFSRVELQNTEGEVTSKFKSGEPILFKVQVDVNSTVRNPVFSLRISDLRDVNIITWRSNDFVASPFRQNQYKSFEITIETEDLFLLDGFYNISISFLDGKEILDLKDKCLDFEVQPWKPNIKYRTITRETSTNSLIYSVAKWRIYE